MPLLNLYFKNVAMAVVQKQIDGGQKKRKHSVCQSTTFVKHPL